MSFILDALKKSESDRQRQSGPDISDVPVGTSKRAPPRWLFMLVTLLVVNLTVLFVVLIKPSQIMNPTPATPEDQVLAPVMKPPTTRVATDARAMPQTESRPEPVVGDTTANELEPAFVEPLPVVQRAAPAVTETRLTFNDMRVAGTLEMPDLNIDIHVYSDNPSDRFVFINMNQYRENSTLTEGPLLREITTEGVILEYGGAAFLLPKN